MVRDFLCPTEKGRKKMKNGIKGHKKIFLGIVVAVVILIVVLIAVFGRGGKDDSAKDDQQTATVERRTLAESVSATGTFQASDDVSVSADIMNTTVQEVRVSVGDTVAAGDVICVLDTADLQERLADAQENLSDTESQTNRTVDSARRNLEQAQKNRDEALANVDPDISDAYNDWQEASARYQDLQNQYNAAVVQRDQITAANGGVADVTNSAYWQAQQQVTSLEAQMNTAKSTMELNQRNYQDLADSREDTIRQINDTYQNQLDTYNTTIENSSTAGDTQRDQIEELQDQIDAAVVTAPIGGLVTSLYVEPGDDYNGGMIAAVENVDTFEVTTEIDEYDINKIQVGQEAVIRTNATGDLELSGTVTSIAPKASGGSSILDTGSGSSDMFSFDLSSMMGGSYANGSTGGNVTYTVTIVVNTPCDQLKIGMTAKLSIILQQGENVLSVPFDALQQADDGSYYIEEITSVNEDGTSETKQIPVTTGLESDYYVEIIGDDVKEGMEVLIPEAEGGNSLEDLISSGGAMEGI